MIGRILLMVGSAAVGYLARNQISDAIDGVSEAWDDICSGSPSLERNAASVTEDGGDDSPEDSSFGRLIESFSGASDGSDDSQKAQAQASENGASTTA